MTPAPPLTCSSLPLLEERWELRPDRQLDRPDLREEATLPVTGGPASAGVWLPMARSPSAAEPPDLREDRPADEQERREPADADVIVLISG